MNEGLSFLISSGEFYVCSIAAIADFLERLGIIRYGNDYTQIQISSLRDLFNSKEISQTYLICD